MLRDVPVEAPPMRKSVNACAARLMAFPLANKCIYFPRTEVPVGQNANERTAFQLSAPSHY
jgi:hypothetical protein